MTVENGRGAGSSATASSDPNTVRETLQHGRRNGRHFVWVDDYTSAPLARLLADPDLALKNPETQILKTDRTTTVAIVRCAERKLVLKRYNTKNTWHALRRLLRVSRAQNCWDLTSVFRSVGLDTANRVALIEQRMGPFKGCSWFVSEFVEGAMLLDVLHACEDSVRVAQLADQAIAILQVLERHRLSHGDMKATNILVCDGRLTLVDLDAARLHRSPSTHQSALSKDRTRFLKNWRDQPELWDLFQRKFRDRGWYER